MPEKQTLEPLPRVSWAKRLQEDVKYFHAQTGMKFESIGRRAIKNARFWERMAAGGTITIEKADEIYEWMATQGYHFNS